MIVIPACISVPTRNDFMRTHNSSNIKISEKYVALLAEDDVHVLTGALKLFFRELSEPIFPTNLARDFIYANRK